MAREREREGGRQIVAGSSNQRIGGSRAIRCGWHTLVAHMAREPPRNEGKRKRERGRLCFCNKTTQEKGRYFCFPSLSLPLPYPVGPSPSSASVVRARLLDERFMVARTSGSTVTILGDVWRCCLRRRRRGGLSSSLLIDLRFTDKKGAERAEGAGVPGNEAAAPPSSARASEKVIN